MAQPSYHIMFWSLDFWYVLGSSIIHPHDRLDLLFFPSLYPSFLSNALSGNRFDYSEWNMIDDYDSSEGRWGLGAFLVGGGRVWDDVRRRTFGESIWLAAGRPLEAVHTRY